MKTNTSIALCFIYLTLSGEAFRMNEKANALFSERPELEEPKKNTEDWVKFKMSQKFSKFGEKPSMKVSGSGGSIGKLFLKFTAENKRYAADMLERGSELLSDPEGLDPEISEEDSVNVGVAQNLQIGMNKWFDKHGKEDNDIWKGCAFHVERLSGNLAGGPLTIPVLQQVMQEVLQGTSGAGSCKASAMLAAKVASNPWWVRAFLDTQTLEETTETTRQLAELETQADASTTNASLVELDMTILPGAIVLGIALVCLIAAKFAVWRKGKQDKKDLEARKNLEAARSLIQIQNGTTPSHAQVA